MLRVQLKHVDLKPIQVEMDGKNREVFIIALPPQITKGVRNSRMLRAAPGWIASRSG